MNQRQKIYNFVINHCNKKGSRTFDLKSLQSTINHEELGIKGNSPESTVRRLLQELGKESKIKFNEKQRGHYTLLKHDLLQDEVADKDMSIINASANQTPNKREYLIEMYARNRGWVKLAKEKFGQYCLYPKCSNTFKNNSGTPYIEVHHIIPLFKGGEDGIWNLSVVCAHHHRMAHFADDKTKINVENYLHTETESRLKNE